MKQIAHLFQSFLPSSHSAFETRLSQSTLLQNSSNISMTDILYLIECFEGYGPECNGVYLSGSDYMQQFFTIITSKPQPTLVCIKLTLTIHLIIYEFQVGDLVAEQILKQGNNLTPREQSSSFISNYKGYLMKLAQSLRIFYAAKVGQYPPLEQNENELQKMKISLNEQNKPTTQYDTDIIFESQAQFKQIKENKQFGVNNAYFQRYQQQQLEKQFMNQAGFISEHQKILILFKLHNLLNQCLAILSQTIDILFELKNVEAQALYEQQIQKKKKKEDPVEISSLYIEIACVLWNDTMVIYKFCGNEVHSNQINNQIHKMFDSFRSLDHQQLIALQQLYFSTIQMTEKTKQIYHKKHAFDVQKIVRKPSWFEENKKLTKEIEEVIIDRKVSQKIKQLNILLRSSSQRVTTLLQTPQAKFSPINIQMHPFSARNSNLNKESNQPFFISKHKKNQSQQVPNSPPDSRRHQYVKQLMGGIFEEECISASKPNQLQKRESLFESILSNKESTSISRNKLSQMQAKK